MAPPPLGPPDSRTPYSSRGVDAITSPGTPSAVHVFRMVRTPAVVTRKRAPVDEAKVYAAAYRDPGAPSTRPCAGALSRTGSKLKTRAGAAGGVSRKIEWWGTLVVISAAP